MDIKEIAERVSKRIYVEDGLLLSKFISEKFAEALVAELAKQNEPCAFLHEWIEYHPFGDTVAGEPCAAITNDEKPFDSSYTVSHLFTYPPTAEQIANETAEAIAKMLDDAEVEETHYCMNIYEEGKKFQFDMVEAIRSGAWKEFKRS